RPAAPRTGPRLPSVSAAGATALPGHASGSLRGFRTARADRAGNACRDVRPGWRCCSSASHEIGDLPLHPSEVEEAAEEQGDDGRGGEGEQGDVGSRLPEERPAKTFDNTRHRVEAEEPAEPLRHEARGVGDRCYEEPELRQERDGVLNV